MNGSWRTWALGTAVALLFAMTSYNMARFDSKLDNVAGEQARRSERFARIEAEVNSLRQELRHQIERSEYRALDMQRRLDALEKVRK